MPGMRRREFVSLFGGAAVAWPLAARAQQPTMPVIGFLSSISAADRPHHTEAFRQGLNETGYAEARNVTIEYRYADNRMDQLRPLAADLIARKVAVIAAVAGNNTALVAKTLTSTIPILFTSGVDPIKAGLVVSLNRPEANVTGVSWFSAELGQKHIEVLHELVPKAELIALLLNPNNPEGAFYEQSAQNGARALGRRLLVLKAGTAPEIDAAFATLAGQAGECCELSALIHSMRRASGNSPCWRRGMRFRRSMRARFRRGRRPDQLWQQRNRCISTGRHLCRPHPQGCQAR